LMSSQHPIIFEPVDDSRYIYVLMPTALKTLYSDMAYDDDPTVSHYLRDEA